MLTGTVPAALSEFDMMEEQVNEASNIAYDEAILQGETQIAFTVVATLGQYLSDLMVYTYGEIPPSETDSTNAAVQLVDEVIRRADLCFHSGKAGIDKKMLAVFVQAKEAWKTDTVQFGPASERFEAGLLLVDNRVIDPATEAFDRIPAEAQPVYLERAENVYRAIWQILRPAVTAKIGETLGIQDLVEFAGSEEISLLEDAAVEILVDVKGILSILSGGIDGKRSEERARIEQVGARLNSLEAEVKLLINALGIDTVSRLQDDGE